PRFTATRSCAPQLRISVTPGCFTLSTRTCTSFPPPVEYGGPITRHSARSSVRRSPSLRSIGKTRSSGAFGGSGLLAGGAFPIHSHLTALARRHRQNTARDRERSAPYPLGDTCAELECLLGCRAWTPTSAPRAAGTVSPAWSVASRRTWPSRSSK